MYVPALQKLHDFLWSVYSITQWIISVSFSIVNCDLYSMSVCINHCHYLLRNRKIHLLVVDVMVVTEDKNDTKENQERRQILFFFLRIWMKKNSFVFVRNRSFASSYYHLEKQCTSEAFFKFWEWSVRWSTRVCQSTPCGK